jgi:ABC-2 type transport system ATP-binding protein
MTSQLADTGSAASEARATSAADPAVIAVESVSKWFGSVVAVNEVSFEVRPGITGLLGPNGAGKTTLLRLISGLVNPSQGRVRVFGEDPRRNRELYRRIGVMSEHESTYDLLTGRQLVELSARLRGVAAVSEAARRAIGQVDLVEAAGRPIRTYSRGMKQRIKLAATLAHEPELLILDEPLSGADPRQRVEFQELLRKLAREGRTILISSHILEEVEALASTVLLVVNGKLAAEGDHHAIRAAIDERPYHVRVIASAPRELAAGLVKLDTVDSVEIGSDGEVVLLSRNVGAVQQALPALAGELSIRLLRVEPLDDSLESVFEYLVER